MGRAALVGYLPAGFGVEGGSPACRRKVDGGCDVVEVGCPTPTGARWSDLPGGSSRRAAGTRITDVLHTVEGAHRGGATAVADDLLEPVLRTASTASPRPGRRWWRGCHPDLTGTRRRTGRGRDAPGSTDFSWRRAAPTPDGLHRRAAAGSATPPRVMGVTGARAAPCEARAGLVRATGRSPTAVCGGPGRLHRRSRPRGGRLRRRRHRRLGVRARGLRRTRWTRLTAALRRWPASWPAGFAFGGAGLAPPGCGPYSSAGQGAELFAGLCALAWVCHDAYAWVPPPACRRSGRAHRRVAGSVLLAGCASRAGSAMTARRPDPHPGAHRTDSTEWCSTSPTTMPDVTFTRLRATPHPRAAPVAPARWCSSATNCQSVQRGCLADVARRVARADDTVRERTACCRGRRPARHTPEGCRDYLARFDPSFLACARPEPQAGGTSLGGPRSPARPGCRRLAMTWATARR